MLAVTPHSVGFDAIILNENNKMKNDSRMTSKKFQRTIEDFVCEKCEEKVKGSGYTNHCSKCLWSKHVDINPGDRAEDCGGMMKPIGYNKIGGKEKIIHQCHKCGFEKSNKIEKEDNIDVIAGMV